MTLQSKSKQLAKTPLIVEVGGRDHRQTRAFTGEFDAPESGEDRVEVYLRKASCLDCRWGLVVRSREWAASVGVLSQLEGACQVAYFWVHFSRQDFEGVGYMHVIELLSHLTWAAPSEHCTAPRQLPSTSAGTSTQTSAIESLYHISPLLHIALHLLRERWPTFP